MKFKDILNEANITTIEKAFGDKLLPFLDALTFYIDYNDEQSKKEISSFKSELKKSGFLTKPKSVFRLARLKGKETPKKPKTEALTSTSTEKMQGKMLELMKGMVNQYKTSGDYYYLELENVEGFDVNEFAKEFHKNKKKLIQKYDVDGHIMAFFFETIENKSEQKEFLVFGGYSISDKIKI